MPKPTPDQRDRALAQLARSEDTGDGPAVDDPVLNAALDPFRGQRPLELRCPKSGCRGTIAWIALAPTQARVIFSLNGPRKGHVAKLNPDGPPPHRMAQPPAPFNYWSLGPSGGIDSAQPANPPGQTDLLRWRFTCRKCGSSYTLKNSTMIAKLATAHTRGEREIGP